MTSSNKKVFDPKTAINPNRTIKLLNIKGGELTSSDGKQYEGYEITYQDLSDRNKPERIKRVPIYTEEGQLLHDTPAFIEGDLYQVKVKPVQFNLKGRTRHKWEWIEITNLTENTEAA
ncbi:hypothetical protein [Pseudoalteromonas pernae]|uniref:hypothetical protein n=1 Tax=Pseudoalteromonas pernae TaxID=3118054 RepID=UPI00324243F3